MSSMANAGTCVAVAVSLPVHQYKEPRSLLYGTEMTRVGLLTTLVL